MKGKKFMKILLSMLVLIVIAVAIILGYKIIQLKKLEKMTVDDMISYVTEEKDIYVSIAILQNGDITYHTYGQSGTEIDRTDLQYEIGSISKTMAAMLTAKAVDEGKINLSASISEYLDLPAGRYYPTIERLLTHTSGYKSYYFESEMIKNHLSKRNDFYGISRDKLLKKVSELSLEDKDYPFKYSNFGISVLGLVLEKVYQKDYTELLSEYLRNELDLKNTSVASCTGNLSGYWDWAEKDGYIPAGAIISDIEDMSKYLNFCMTSDKSYARMPFTTIKKVDANISFYTSMGIYIDELGMTWIRDTKHHLYWHNGGTSNYNSYIALSEDYSTGIVILSNYGPDKKIPVTVIGAKMMTELMKN